MSPSVRLFYWYDFTITYKAMYKYSCVTFKNPDYEVSMSKSSSIEKGQQSSYIVKSKEKHRGRGSEVVLTS